MKMLNKNQQLKKLKKSLIALICVMLLVINVISFAYAADPPVPTVVPKLPSEIPAKDFNGVYLDKDMSLVIPGVGTFDYWQVISGVVEVKDSSGNYKSVNRDDLFFDHAMTLSELRSSIVSGNGGTSNPFFNIKDRQKLRDEDFIESFSADKAYKRELTNQYTSSGKSYSDEKFFQDLDSFKKDKKFDDAIKHINSVVDDQGNIKPGVSNDVLSSKVRSFLQDTKAGQDILNDIRTQSSDLKAKGETLSEAKEKFESAQSDFKIGNFKSAADRTY